MAHSSDETGEAALNARIAAMRRLIDQMKPGTGAEALRALREHFPDAELEERVAAVAGRTSSA